MTSPDTLCGTLVIRKPFKGTPPTDRFGKAGFAAEKQMAFYLNRAFQESSDIFVYNDLRFVRNEEVAQIDHLVLHRYGFTLIESKSVTGKVEVNKQLEFVRVWGQNRTGMKSPIAQVAMQAELLQNLLNDHKESLRRKVMFGLVQAEFGDVRFTKFVAVSDQGEIKREQCDPPELKKADSVISGVREIIRLRDELQGFKGAVRRAAADKQQAAEMDERDITPLTDVELTAIQKFLRQHHQSAQRKRRVNQSKPAKRTKAASGTHSDAAVPATETSQLRNPTTPSKAVTTADEKPNIAASAAQPRNRKQNTEAPDPPSDQPACRHCGVHHLQIAYGRYGYYFQCLKCHGNTPIAVTCDGCNATARISKQKLQFSKTCSTCGQVDYFFTNPKVGKSD
ncbi:MAG: nuclease-related domain-containing protein [Fuerstiella sp.]